MDLLRSIAAWFKHHFLPGEHNAYRPNSLSRDVLVAAVTLTCVVEGFLVASLFIQSRPGEFTAAVIESAIISLTNGERVSHGAGELHVNEVLTRAAQAKANDMAARGYFSHVGPTGEQPWKWFAEAGYDYAYAGENLATRFYESSDVVTAWMNSPGHRANVLKGVYQDIGIGIASGLYEGQQTIFVVQFFGTTKAELGLSKGAPIASTASTTPTPSTRVASAATSTPVTRVTPAVTAPTTTPNQTAAAPTQPVVEGESISVLSTNKIPSSLARFLASPRTIALSLLGAIVAFLVIALVLAVVVRIQIQPLDLLLNGAVVAAFTLMLFAANVYFLSGANIPAGPAAAIESIESMESAR